MATEPPTKSRTLTSSAIRTVTLVTGSDAPTVGALTTTLKDSSPSTNSSSLKGMTMLWLVSPGARAMVPVTGV